MLLLFNVDRPLQRIAAEARVKRGVASIVPDAHWHGLPVAPPPSSPPATANPDTSLSDTEHSDLAVLICAALVGDADAVDEALTDDAEVWSPSVSFRSRADVTAALRDEIPVLVIEAFQIEHLTCNGQTVFVEWKLEALQSDPLLVDDDVLVETTDEPITLGGVTMALVQEKRIARLHTYYDAAALIEQLIVRR